MFSRSFPFPFRAALFALGLCAAAFSPAAGRAASEAPKPGASSFGNYLAGRHAQAVREMGAAIAFYSAVLAREPNNPDLLRRGFILHLAEGRVADALGLAGRMDAKDAARLGFPEFLRAADDIKNGRHAAAIKRLDALENDGLATLVVPMLRGWAEMGRGDRAAAAKALNALAGKEGMQSFLDLHGAIIADVAGDWASAEANYGKVIDDDGGASLRLTVLLGNLHERMGQTDKARTLYDAFIARNPDSHLLDPAARRIAEKARPPKAEIAGPAAGAAEALFGVAGSLRQQNARETALLFARMALHLRPDFPPNQVLIADILENDGRFADANAVYEGIAKDSPFHRATRPRIAANLDRMDRTDEAVGRLNALAAAEAKDIEPLVQLGDILRGRKRFKEAAAAYDRAFQRIPTLDRRHWSLLYSRGIALERSDQWPRAEADFLKALEFEPEQPYVLNYLGYSWIEKRQHLERATDMIRRAVALRPNDGYIVDSLGWVHYQLGDYAGAAKELERAVELRPEDPVINDHFGDALWRVGRRIEARFQWERALSLKPEPDQIEPIKKKLLEGLPDDPPAGRKS